VTEPPVDDAPLAVEAPVEAAPPEPTAPPPSSRRIALTALGVALGTTVVVTLASAFAPPRFAATAVGVSFLAATWLFVLRKDEDVIRAHGLSLGGVLEPTRIDPRRALADAARAMGWALAFALVIFPIFWVGFRFYWHPPHPFHFRWPTALLDEVAGQLVVIALPEEAFFRGYLQSELDRAWTRRVMIFGAPIGLGLPVSAAIFAVGHLLTIHSPARLAVFFPALLFGWMRARTKGVGSSVVFHAMCNLFSSALAHGYGLA
jgi:hypothetical protein